MVLQHPCTAQCLDTVQSGSETMKTSSQADSPGCSGQQCRCMICTGRGVTSHNTSPQFYIFETRPALCGHSVALLSPRTFWLGLGLLRLEIWSRFGFVGRVFTWRAGSDLGWRITLLSVLQSPDKYPKLGGPACPPVPQQVLNTKYGSSPI